MCHTAVSETHFADLYTASKNTHTHTHNRDWQKQCNTSANTVSYYAIVVFILSFIYSITIYNARAYSNSTLLELYRVEDVLVSPRLSCTLKTCFTYA